jgi:hypothetical protein
MSDAEFPFCPLCEREVMWATCGSHHEDRPLGLYSHICGDQRVVVCVYCNEYEVTAR